MRKKVSIVGAGNGATWSSYWIAKPPDGCFIDIMEGNPTRKVRFSRMARSSWNGHDWGTNDDADTGILNLA